MPAYQTPGVYWEGRDATPPTVDAVRMDVAGFVGIALKGPVDTAVPIESLRQFQAHFGDFTGGGYLAYTLKAFFDNGGQRAWVVRVATGDGPNAAAPAAIQIAPPPMPLFPAWPASWSLQASSPGTWGNAVAVSIRPGTRVATASLAIGTTPDAIAVASVAGFERDSLVRISQPGRTPALRVLALTDATARLLYLVNPEPRLRRDFEAPLLGLDLTQPLLVESLTYSVLVRDGAELVGLATDLSIVPTHPRYVATVLGPVDYSGTIVQAAPPRAPFPVAVLPLDAASAAALPLEPATGAFLPLTGGLDGLSDLGIVDFIGEPFPPELGLTVRRRGLQVFERVDEPAALAIPDILIQPESPPIIVPPPLPQPDPCAPCPSAAAPAPLRPRPVAEPPPIFSDDQVFQVQQALVEHCELRGDRIALLDPPFSAIASPNLGIAPLQAWRARFDSRYAAYYVPWLSVPDPLLPGELRAVPACGHVGGQYSFADSTEGVYRAPANFDLVWAQAATMTIRDTEHGLLNSQGVNVIRPALGRALRILGARTVSSDPIARFVPVRRLIILLIRSFDRATQWAVFEPNDHRTRSNIAVGFSNFLSGLWQAGGLAGSTPDQAFVVRCDETNNTQATIDNGWLVCDIAVAPTDPLEFVVLRVGRVGDELEVQESSIRLQESTS
jgi:phage tail sheath protein FI